MKIFSPVLKGTTVSDGTSNLSGSFTGSLSGTATTASNANTASYVVSSVTDQTQNTRLQTLESVTGSFALTSSFGAYTSSNDTTNTTQNARLLSNEQKTGSFATTGSNFFIGTQVITGSVYIANDLIVQGSSSLQNITASAVSIGTNTVILNTDTPILRFGGISVQDSGSTQGRSGSLFWDSVHDHWIYVVPSGSSEGYNSAMLMNGPKNTGSLGSEGGLTTGYVPRSQGEDHLEDSNIFSTGSNVGIGTTNPSQALHVAGALRLTSNPSVTGDTNSAHFWNQSGVGPTIAGANFQVQTNGATSSLYIDSSQRVGIGTTNPSYQLNLSAASSTYISIDNTSNNYRLLLGAESAGAAFYSRNLSTNAAVDMRFVVGTSEAVRITSGGNVGIGFTNPSSSLAVNGNVSIGANLTPSSLPHGLDTNARALTIAGSGTNPNYGVLFLANNSTEASGALLGGLLYSQVNSGKSGTNAATKAGISVWSAGSGGSVGGYGGYMALFTRPDNAGSDIGAYERMRIDMNGNIGIGTTSPGYKLSVANEMIVGAQGGSDYLYLSGGSGYGAKVRLYYANASLNTELGGNSNTLLNIVTGNVGIGTNNPVTKLNVQEGTASSYTGGGPGDSIRVSSGNTSVWVSTVYNGVTAYFGSITDGSVKFAGYNYATGAGVNMELGQSSMFIKANNNVGIGTSNPGYKFEVNGSTYLANSSKFIVNGANYNENIRTYAASNDYSSYILGAVSGDTGSGVGQWSIVRWPSGNGYQFTIRYNGTDYFYLYANGNYSFYGSNVSDARKKTNITYIEDDQLDTIMKLKPATFSKVNPAMYSESDETYVNNNIHTGFIAQDVLAENIPNILTGSEEEGYGLDYDGILSLAVKAIQELKAEVDTLRAQISQ
jgi:hypothetical protein